MLDYSYGTYFKLLKDAFKIQMKKTYTMNIKNNLIRDLTIHSIY